MTQHLLFKQSGANTAAENDEFIELYNAGSVAIDLTRLRLIDGNLFTNEIDGTSGNITGNSNAFNLLQRQTSLYRLQAYYRLTHLCGYLGKGKPAPPPTRPKLVSKHG